MTTARLSDKLLIAPTTIEWSLTTGVNPNTATFEMETSFAKGLEARAGKDPNTGLPSTVTLSISDTGQAQGDLEIKGLYVTGIVSSGNPFTRLVVVHDVRWLWARKHILRRYNIRRRVGERALIEHDQIQDVTPTGQDALGNVQTVKDIVYARWSLNGQVPWKAIDVLEDIMAEMGTPFRIDKKNIPNDIPIDSLELDDSFDAALRRVLAYIPGLDVFINHQGEAIFFNRLSDPPVGVSDDVSKAGGGIIVGGGWVDRMSKSRIRPERIDVLFSKEIEVRMNSVEGGRSPGIGLEALENVLPIPDAKLKVANRTLLSGNWITIDEAISAWNESGVPPGCPPLSRQLILEGWHFNGLLACYAQSGRTDPNADWASRISTLRNHFRQTYRIKREVLDSIYQVRAHRIGTFDFETGERARSLVWMDYGLRPTTRGTTITAVDSKFGVNVFGYSVELNQALSPAIELSILDEEQGIIRVNFRGDPLTRFNEMTPGTTTNIPSWDMSGVNGFRFYEEFNPLKSGNIGQLAVSHGMATILTVSLAVPNTTAQLQRVSVTPEQAEEKLKKFGRTGDIGRIRPSTGPVMEVRVGAGVTTARIAWIDALEHEVEVLLNMGLSPFSAFNVPTFDILPTGVLTNVQFSDRAWTNKQECEDIAVAMAAEIYAGLADRLEGTQTTIMQPRAGISGTIDRLTHRLEPNGAMTTSIDLPATTPVGLNFLSLLEPSTRRVIFRQVQP